MFPGILALLLWTACAVNAQTTTYSGETGTWNDDTLNDSSNWDNGVPSGSNDVVIAEGEYASV